MKLQLLWKHDSYSHRKQLEIHPKKKSWCFLSIFIGYYAILASPRNLASFLLEFASKIHHVFNSNCLTPQESGIRHSGTHFFCLHISFRTCGFTGKWFFENRWTPWVLQEMFNYSLNEIYALDLPTPPKDAIVTTWIITSWWLNQPIWKIWVKMGIFPKFWVKRKNIWNHHSQITFLASGIPNLNLHPSDCEPGAPPRGSHGSDINKTPTGWPC